MKQSTLKCIALLFCFTLAITAKAQTLEQSINALASESYNNNEPGVALLVAKNGRTIYRNAFGKANLELDVNMSADNVFQLASITKQFTAVAILMLEEQGKLSVNDPLTKFIPDYPTQGTTITIHHLLNHTSGIKSYTSMNLHGIARKDMTPTELIDFFKNEPMDFKPGEKYEYNNSGYILLGHIIEVVTKDTYENFIENNIFKPLKMNNSLYGSVKEIIPNRANGYQESENGYANADYLSLTIPYAAGSLMSTVDDMLKWQNALTKNILLKQSTFEKAINGSILNNGEKIDYGYGLGTTKIQGAKGYTHSGGIFGYTTNGIYLKNEDVYVIGLSNCSCNDIGALTKKVAALAIGKPFPSIKDAVTLKDEDLKQWVGAYKFEDDVIRFISFEDGKLMSQREGSSKFKIYPLNKNHFIFEDVTLAYHFSKDNNGKKQLIMNNSGNEVKATETDKEFPKEKETIEISETTAKQYEGKYQLAPEFIITITAKANQVFAQATGQGQFEIFPHADNKFFAKVAPIEIEFNTNDSGEIDKLTLYQGGAVTPAKKIE